MDAIISSALEEICSKGRDGVALSSLCSKLGLSVEIRRALWANLLEIPAVQFQKRDRVYDHNDPLVRRFEDAEKLDLIIVAKDKLCDNFSGVYDFSFGDGEKEVNQQRFVLQRIASARASGITQNQLSKEFGIKGNRFFYVVRKLEKRGLIVRQEAVEKTRGSSKQKLATRLIHLYRYAKHLGSQEKFEVTKDEGSIGKEDSEDVLINDYLPSIKTICDKLEETHGKALVISGIKRDLGYFGSRNARHEWKKIYGRLINAGLVEETTVKVNGKGEPCLHLLKKFCPLDYERNTTRCVEGKEFKFGRCQIANQLVELPIDHQIYDTIDATGSKGMLITEVGKRFGINKKTNHRNCFSVSSRFGMPMQMELHNKSHEYRIRTSRNSESSNPIPRKKSSLGGSPSILDGSARISHLWNFESDTLWKTNNHENEIKLSSSSPRDSEASYSISNTCKPQELIHETRSTFSSTAIHSMKKLKLYQFSTVDSTRREQRILERLQVEKIVLRSELYKLLVNLEKDKGTTMGRRTVDKMLYKLENEGHCKCIHLDLNGIMNTNFNSKVKVVLHPSILSLSSEVIGIIRNKLKSFHKRTHDPFKNKNSNSVHLFDYAQRTQTRYSSNSLTLRMEAMRANGYIRGKMVRARLLHGFLWDYACSLSARDDVLSYGRQDHDLHNLCVTFDVEGAIKGIPLELFFQVVGSSVIVEKGVYLRDLSNEEYNELYDTSAIRRLSLLVSILQRLKLIRRVNSGSSDDGVTSLHASPVYSLELKPYMEEPTLLIACSNFGSLDLCPDRHVMDEMIRHEFVLSNRDAIDEYWQFLEYTYAGIDLKDASHAFPGSTVHEIFGYSSWASVRRMTVGQKAAVLKLLAKVKFNEKLPYKKCKEISKNLNLTMEQVLRVYYSKLRRRQRAKKLNAQGAECQPLIISSFSRKRKRSAKGRALKHRKVDNETEPFSQQNLPRSAGSDEDFIGEENSTLASPREHESQLQEQQEEDHSKDSERPGANIDKYHSPNNDSAFSKLKSAHQRSFKWTKNADRQLVIQYVKQTVGLGAKLYDEDRVSFGNLPTHLGACRRRMRFLKQNKRFRESLNSLCNMLSKQPEGTAMEKIKFALEEVLQSRQEPIEEAPKTANVCGSQFPPHTGSSAARFSRWLDEHEKDFMRGGLDLTVDLHCGGTFHLFALVSSGELFIFPSVPVEGVGEAEFIKGLSTPFVDDSFDNRREKGFPGIKLSVHRAPTPRAVSLGSSFKNGEHFGNKNHLGNNSGILEVESDSSHSETIKENLNFEHTVPTLKDSCKSPSELMVDHAAHLKMLKKIISKVLRIVLQNPGIREDDIIHKMDLPMSNSQVRNSTARNS
ncbi:hypothetical protein ES332_D06G252100v1 [Gossypium tomentosum]|uniref:Uncharacterized protein n=1 Tax=Gossypium tomentosum TaxID=34277 RepID=A0A5D2KMT6_GOSTO|nr:hypothetical protein ES332_D06G252100v1 [Gossypium tomentosum]